MRLGWLEVDVPPLANFDNAPEGTLGVLGYATFGQEIDAIVRFAKQAIALHTPTENELADGAKDNRPHVALLFRSKTQMPAYEDALEQAGLTTLVVGQAALLERPEIKDILALLHVVCDHTDSAALMRLLATPRFGLSADDLQYAVDEVPQIAAQQHVDQEDGVGHLVAVGAHGGADVGVGRIRRGWIRCVTRPTTTPPHQIPPEMNARRLGVPCAAISCK